MARESDQIAQDYSAMLGSVSVITEVIATHDKGGSATHEDFCSDMTTAEKKERVARSKSYLDHMKALDDWGSENMTPVTNAINAATTFIG
tara:strand:- start:562 stop:831 length:270 start_codon:yes stop_codon:yes gene_type:complete